MKKVLIFGSGSIGNHMSFACRKLGLQVFITDINSKSLIRMKKVIYPKRYKKWDNKITIINYKNVFKMKEIFDIIIIGSPPNTHLNLYFKCVKQLKFKKMLIEKPLSDFANHSIPKFTRSIKNKFIFCGYNHSVSKSFIHFMSYLSRYFKKYDTIEINWKEGFEGILKAHFWLKNEFDSYLGNIKKGGGAMQEHSHGIHLMLVILGALKINYKKLNFNSNIIYKKKNNIKYDAYSNLSTTSKGSLINYETDLKTFPSQKNITISNGLYKANWICNFKENIDRVNIFYKNKMKKNKNFKKSRSSEFENEIKEILSINSRKKYNKSFLNPIYAVETLKIIRKAINER